MAKPKQVLSKREKNFIVALYKEGKTDQQVADVIGLHRETFRRALKNSGLMSTIKKVKEEPDEKVKRSLFERACGYSHPAVKIFCQGAMVTREEYIEHYPPDPTSCIYWLCNRQPEDWKSINHTMISGIGNKPLEIKIIYDEKRKGEDNNGSSSSETSSETK